MFTEQTSNEDRSPDFLSRDTQNSILPNNRLPIRHTFRVGANPKNITSLKADSYDNAANIIAKKVFGANSVIRVTGIEDFCGYFQAVIIDRNKIEVSVGDPFYLARTFDTSTYNHLTKAASAL